jgi:hypothetical protein
LSNKIQMIKLLREECPGIGLKEAKDLIEETVSKAQQYTNDPAILLARISLRIKAIAMDQQLSRLNLADLNLLIKRYLELTDPNDGCNVQHVAVAGITQTQMGWE